MKKRRQQNPQAGFSLPELMVVLAIIMLLVVLAVPRYKKAKHVAEEGAAQATLKSLHTTQEAHRITHGSYAPTFKALAGTGSLPTLDGGAPPAEDSSETSSGESVMVSNGYIFRLNRPLPDEYTVTAEPVEDRDSRPSYTINQLGTLTTSGPPGAGAVGGTKPPADKGKKGKGKK